MSTAAPHPAVREVALAWMLARKDDREDLAAWRRSVPHGLREALDQLLTAYQAGELHGPREGRS